ncbi:MAG: hypothetical protein P1P85_03890 [Patescibacteria group bacterium]|nr:hypothetical protein [Patescibacteria group bacterium]
MTEKNNNNKKANSVLVRPLDTSIYLAITVVIMNYIVSFPTNIF